MINKIKSLEIYKNAISKDAREEYKDWKYDLDTTVIIKLANELEGNYCTKCGTETMLMSGTIYLEVDAEPYESLKYEPSRTGIDEIDKHIIAKFCEKCDEIVNTFNE